MRVKVGVMGSAGDSPPDEAEELRAKAEVLGRAIAARGCVVLTGGTTGLPHLVGAAAHSAGALHVGRSPAADVRDHVGRYGLPTEETDLLVFPGVGAKGRNVVVVPSSLGVLIL